VEMLRPGSALGDKLGKTLEFLFTKAVDLFTKVDFEKAGAQVIDFLEKLPERLAYAGEVMDGFITVAKGVGAVFQFVGESAGNIAAQLYLDAEKIVKFFDDIGTWLGEGAAKLYLGAVDIGSKIWQGIKDGLSAGIHYVIDTVEDMGNAVVGKLKGLLGIHSPSAVFAEMGQMSGEGYAQGLDQAASRIDAMVGQTMGTDSVPAGAWARPAGGGGAGPIQVVVNVTTNVSAQGHADNPQQLGEEVAAHVESMLPGALQAAFERMRSEVGA